MTPLEKRRKKLNKTFYKLLDTLIKKLELKTDIDIPIDDYQELCKIAMPTTFDTLVNRSDACIICPLYMQHAKTFSDLPCITAKFCKLEELLHEDPDADQQLYKKIFTALKHRIKEMKRIAERNGYKR